MMLEVVKQIAKKVAIFVVIFIVLQLFWRSSLVVNSALALLAMLLTNVILVVYYHVMPKYLLPNLSNKAVLITGCDSGFGHELAKKLDGKGVMVFAGCLFPEGAGALALTEHCSDRLKIIHLDVTNDDHVEAAVETVSSTLQDRKLWAIVNNAALGLFSEVEWCTMEAYHNLFEVNVFGTIRVTKAFIPLLRKSQGRVVIVASLLGRVSTYGMSAYTMSKHAVVSFADVLRREMMKWSISVHTIEPSLYKTNITKKETFLKEMDKNWENTPSSIREVYGDDYLKNMKILTCWHVEFGRPESAIFEVVNDMLHATIGQSPKTRYVPGIIGQFWSTAMCETLTEGHDLVSHLLAPRPAKIQEKEVQHSNKI